MGPDTSVKPLLVPLTTVDSCSVKELLQFRITLPLTRVMVRRPGDELPTI